MKHSSSSGGDQQWDSVDRTVKEEGYGSGWEWHSDKADGLNSQGKPHRVQNTCNEFERMSRKYLRERRVAYSRALKCFCIRDDEHSDFSVQRSLHRVGVVGGLEEQRVQS